MELPNGWVVPQTFTERRAIRHGVVGGLVAFLIANFSYVLGLGIMVRRVSNEPSLFMNCALSLVLFCMLEAVS